MRKLKEIMRLKYENKLSNRNIAHSIGVASSTVSRYLSAIEKSGLVWPLAENISEEKLEAMVYVRSNNSISLEGLTPDCLYIHKELQKKNVTKQLLWEEYKEQHSSDNYYSYSQFCNIYRKWCKENKLSMRQTHIAGEKLFIDYCGQTVPIVCPKTGNISKAQIFTAVLGASNYTYVEATMSQSLPDWIMSHVRAFEFFGGVVKILVPDNLKSAVSKACKYEPDINPTYQQMASHYNVAVIPARAYKPKDKAKAEVGVQIVQRFILARLRNHTFYSLFELNKHIKELLVELNSRKFTKLTGSRESLFKELDKPALQSLPYDNYQFIEVKKTKVPPDYHVEIDHSHYSVPYNYVNKVVEIHITSKLIEVYYKGNKITSHVKSIHKNANSTIMEHMPVHHKKFHNLSVESLRKLASDVGTATFEVIQFMLKKNTRPQQAFRSCLNTLELEKKYGQQRLEAACKRALFINSKNRKSILSILQAGLDRIPLEKPKEIPNISHDNIRGSKYYN